MDSDLVSGHALLDSGHQASFSHKARSPGGGGTFPHTSKLLMSTKQSHRPIDNSEVTIPANLQKKKHNTAHVSTITVHYYHRCAGEHSSLSVRHRHSSAQSTLTLHTTPVDSRHAQWSKAAAIATISQHTAVRRHVRTSQASRAVTSQSRHPRFYKHHCVGATGVCRYF